MKYSYCFFLLVFFLFSCGSKNELSEGVITYKIDYPNNKDNFFLYHVLPKELITSFKDNVMELKIKKANLENTVIIDSENKKILSHYNYGDIYTCNLTNSEVNKLIQKQPKYTIKFTNERDTLLGFNVKKAIAIDPDRPFDIIDIWYTEQLKFKNPNWFNGFAKIPGIMLKYDVYQYGLKMEFVASKIENVSLNDSIFEFKRPGKNVNHSVFDSVIVNLFESFK